MYYRAGELDRAEILGTIEELGFEPRLRGEDPRAATGQKVEPGCEALPEPIASELRFASAEGRPLFLDFFAEWCAPCHTLEEEILPHPAVAKALANFRFLRIDTDHSPRAPQCLEVFGLPTIVVLDPQGIELFRHQGLLEAEELAARLAALTSPSTKGL